MRTFGGHQIDIGFAAALGHDNTILAAGFTNSFTSGSPDVYLSLLDSLGGIIRTNVIGGSEADICRSAAACSDFGFVLAGLSRSFGQGNDDAYLVRLDSLGDTVWSRTFGGPGDDRAESIIECTDGGFLLIGWSGSESNGDNVYLVKTDNSGNLLWDRTYGGVLEDRAVSAVEVADGGFVIAGSTQSIADSTDQVLVIKYSAQGDSLWSQVYRPGLAISIVELPSGAMVVGCTQPAIDDGFERRLLIVIDSLGNWVASKTIDNSLNDHHMYDMILLPDGSLCIAGGIEWQSGVWYPEISFRDAESLDWIMRGGIIDIPMPSNNTRIYSIVANDLGGSIYAVGSTRLPRSNQDFCVWRINSN